LRSILETKEYTALPHRQMTQTTVASLVNRIETNVNGLASKLWKDDDLFMIVWNEMLQNVSGYQLAIGTVREDANKSAFIAAKLVHNNEMVTLHSANNVYRLSRVPAERAAFQVINAQLKALRIKNQNNKENKFTNCKLLVSKLRSADCLGALQLLHLEPFLLNVENSNNGLAVFEQLKSSKKMNKLESAPIPTRKSLIKSYLLMANYVQIKQAVGTAPFGQVFEAIDEARGYFSSDLAYRKTLKETKKNEQASTISVVPPDKA
jgi:Family of unknown function (DUF6261)